MMDEWKSKTLTEWVVELAGQLSVTADSLYALGVAWAADRKAWAFPMFNGYGDPIGIRLRTVEGKKFAVTGSHAGIFIPTMKPQGELWILEGPTDTAAALTVGLFSIGRPSCLGCEYIISTFAQRSEVSRVIICADADEPGQRGAEKLQHSLGIPSKIWTPPCKDLRASVAAGLDLKTIRALVGQIL